MLLDVDSSALPELLGMRWIAEHLCAILVEFVDEFLLGEVAGFAMLDNYWDSSRWVGDDRQYGDVCFEESVG